MQHALAWMLGLWGRVDEALPVSLRSIDASPGCWECYDTLAMLVAKTGAFAKAAEIQALAVNLMPDYVSEPDVIDTLRKYEAAMKAAVEPPPPKDKLSDAVIRAIVKKRDDGIQQCHPQGLARDPKLEGRVIVELVIARDGVVSSVKDAGSTSPDAQVMRCIVGELATLRFPAREEGESQTVTYPLF